ncbi:hypothetical protein R1sor_020514 [Riccia sorocarpa]|uniref:DUF1648 domain-containing protein n=1 Tax=Riccia sorocarpa TaxID=122646 RepID=A0ABD3IK36_9MARC
MGAHPLALAFVLAIVSAFHGLLKWHDTPSTVPAWWNIHAHPIYFVPKWFGFTLLPVLIVLIPYIFRIRIRAYYLSGEEKHAIADFISIPALFLFVLHNFILLDAFVSQSGDISPRFLVFNVALWLFIWAGHNFRHVPRNSDILTFSGGDCYEVRYTRTYTEAHEHYAWTLEITGLVLLICAFFVPTGVGLLVLTLVLWLGSYLYIFLYSVAKLEFTDG